MEELFRHRVLTMLMKKGLLSEERVRLLQSRENSGFTVNAAVRIGADDAGGRENLARYLKRFSRPTRWCVRTAMARCGWSLLIEEPRVVRAILVHLLLWDAPRPRPPRVAAVVPADFEDIPCED